MKLRNSKSICINVQQNPSRKRINKSTPCKSQPNRSIKPINSVPDDEFHTHSDEVSVPGISRNIVGVTKRKSGKYGVKIHDRIRKKDVWLGTFESQEEASKAYWAKKHELEKEFEDMARKVDVVEKTKKTSEFVGVSRRASGKFAAHIRDPIRKKKLYLGVFDSEQKASEVYLAKKAELEEEVKKEGVHWYLGRREGRKATSLQIRKRRDFGEGIRKSINCGEIIKRRRIGGKGRFLEDNWSETSSDYEESDMEFDDFESSEGKSASSDAEDSDIEFDEFDSNDAVNGESGPSNAQVSTEDTLMLKEAPCLDNQESLKEEINQSVFHKENVTVETRDSEQDLANEKNGAQIVVVDDNSSVQPLIVNPFPARIPGATILLRTKSGTPLMDSNGFLLGEWSWIDDMRLTSKW